MLPQVNIIRAKNADFLSFYEAAGISGVLTAHGVWDELTIQLSKTIIDTTKLTPVIFDIGANMGTFSVPIGRYIAERNGIIHAFEPQRIIYYQLCGNIFLNKMENIYAHNVALSNINRCEDVKPLNFSGAWNIGAYSLSSTNINEQPLSEKLERCVFKKLDDIKFDVQITLMKIDVEGMELEVLHGAREVFEKQYKPPVFFEFNSGDPKGPAVMQFLLSYGYKISKYADSDYLAQHADFPANII